MAGSILSDQAWKQMTEVSPEEMEIKLLASLMEDRRFDTIRYWIENRGAEQINKAKPMFGIPLLSWVAMHGREDLLKAALAKPGIDVNVTDSAGKTPLDHATRYPEIAKRLRQAGAQNGISKEQGLALTS